MPDTDFAGSPERFPSRLSSMRRFRAAAAVLALFVVVSTVVRLGLAAFNGDASLWQPQRLLAALGLGATYDIAMGLWWTLPLVLAAWWWPGFRGAERWLGRVNVLLIGAAIGALVLVSVAEFVFWNEFASRFNFIAVDYLVYTREVIGNIRESYPVRPMLAGVAIVSALLTWALVRWLGRRAGPPAPSRLGARSAWAIGWVALTVLVSAAVDSDWKNRLADPQLQQLAGNGPWEFLHAVRYNEIEFQRFYATLPPARANALLRSEFADSRLYRLTGSADMPIEREMVPHGPVRRTNVVLVSIESLGAEFIESLGGSKGLTPNLERLGREGLFFSRLYATGTRTVRGLEALTLSVPPTPGHAVPMRPHNGGLFTLGGVLKANGYEPLYLYGGYGEFDNMKTFFGGNGYTVIDRKAIAAKDISYENIWGVADEDLFTLAIREIDKRSAAGKPVFAHIMTTSNHRPFTYPAGRIDVPPGTGRDGAVKYTDYAIGRFIEAARSKPWFDDTLFVFIADHTSIARGRTDLPLERYHIPMVMYAPKYITVPRRVDTLASQIDVAPTLLGWLNMPYVSQFFGRDVLNDHADPHVFLANYQSVGFVDDDGELVLRPKRQIETLNAETGAPFPASRASALVDEGIAFYQVAAQRFSAERLAGAARSRQVAPIP